MTRVFFTCHCRNMGVERTTNESRQRKLTLEKEILLLLLLELKLSTFQSWIQRFTNWAILGPLAIFVRKDFLRISHNCVPPQLTYVLCFVDLVVLLSQHQVLLLTVLDGPGIQSEHCHVKNKDGQVVIFPRHGAQCKVNGVAIHEPTTLTQGSRKFTSVLCAV